MYMYMYMYTYIQCQCSPQHTCTVYVHNECWPNYHIARKFGGELNLAVWQSILQRTAKLKSAKISYLHNTYTCIIW